MTLGKGSSLRYYVTFLMPDRRLVQLCLRIQATQILFRFRRQAKKKKKKKKTQIRPSPLTFTNHPYRHSLLPLAQGAS